MHAAREKSRQHQQHSDEGILTDAVQLMLVLHYALTSNGPLLGKLGATDY